jgi:hypothetical protein
MTPNPPRSFSARASSQKPRRWGWWVLGGLALVVVVGVGVGTAMAGSIVRGKLELVAREAKLQLVLGDVAVKPWGHLHMTGLELKRADGTAVLKLDEADAQFSPWRVLAGRRHPNEAALRGFSADLVLQDGKPNELIDLYRAVRTVFPKRAVDTDDEPKQVTAQGLTLERGQVTLRLLGKGSQLLPKGLTVRDLTVKVDLGHGVGDVAAVVDGAVASKLAAKLVPQPQGPPKLEARFDPEFKLAFPADAGLPLRIDQLAVVGFGVDPELGGAVEGVALRSGGKDVIAVKRVVPARGSLGLRMEEIAFAVAESKPVVAPPKPAKGKPPATPPKPASAPERIWTGTLAQISAGVTPNEKAEMTLTAQLENLQIALPGAATPAQGMVRVAKVELRTDRLPQGDRPLDALTRLDITDPALELPWQEGAVSGLPGGKLLWEAITAAERAKLRQQAAEEVDDELVEDPSLPPEARRKKVEERVNQKLQQAGLAEKPQQKGKAKAGAAKTGGADDKDKKGPGAASRSAVANAVKPLRDLHEKLVGLGESVQKVLDVAGRMPRLHVDMKGGRVTLQRPGADKPMGGIQDIGLQWTAVLGDGTRGLLASVKPFDDERTWGEVKLDVVSGPGTQLQRAKLSIQGSQFAQVLRIVSSNVTVGADSDLAANLELRLPDGQLEVTGDYKVQNLGFDWWRLAPKPIDIAGLQGKVRFSASRAGQDLRLELPDLTLGDAVMAVRAEATELASKPTVHFRAEMPKQDCGKALASIPPGMTSTIGGLTATGEFSWLVDLTVPLQNVYKANLELELDDTTCEITAMSALDVAELAKDFVRPVNENGVVLEDVLVGPQSEAWVPLAELKPWVPWAMIATEDGAFYKHRGLRPGLLLRAIRLDLDYGRFVYGGSTITQQLVKNVYLTRAKHLSRKFEELLIVWHMERLFPKLLDEPAPDAPAKPQKPGQPPSQPVGHKGKDRILELYVNMIEFGPKLYGVQRAAQAYFGKDARELTPLEAAFLAANKPCPRCGFARFANKKWDPWWQERMIGIMTKMRDEGIIAEDQFLAEAPYVPKFLGWPQTVAPQPGAELGGVEE